MTPTDEFVLYKKEFSFCLFTLYQPFDLCCQRLELSSIWALLAGFEDPLPVPGCENGFPLEGAFVKGVDSISWMGNNTKKLLGSCNDGPNCWTFLSTAAYGKRNKVPQVCVYSKMCTHPCRYIQ